MTKIIQTTQLIGLVFQESNMLLQFFNFYLLEHLGKLIINFL